MSIPNSIKAVRINHYPDRGRVNDQLKGIAAFLTDVRFRDGVVNDERRDASDRGYLVQISRIYDNPLSLKVGGLDIFLTKSQNPGDPISGSIDINIRVPERVAAGDLMKEIGNIWGKCGSKGGGVSWVNTVDVDKSFFDQKRVSDPEMAGIRTK